MKTNQSIDNNKVSNTEEEPVSILKAVLFLSFIPGIYVVGKLVTSIL